MNLRNGLHEDGKILGSRNVDGVNHEAWHRAKEDQSTAQETQSNPLWSPSIAEFVENNPAWPLADTLRRNAEQALAGEPPSARTLEWFAKYPPRSGGGMVRLALALQNAGRTTEAADWAQRAWTTAALPNEAEAAVLGQWGRQLTQADHEQRLDSLIWLGRPNEAKRLVPRIPLPRRAVAEARIALATQSPGVDGALSRVGATQMTDPGLVYERVRWRRRNGNTQGAIDLLAPMGGYKQSGNGREYGAHAINEFLELKSLMNFA